MRRCTTVYNDTGAEVYSIEIDIPDAVRIKRKDIDPRHALNSASRAAEDEVLRILDQVDEVPPEKVDVEAIRKRVAGVHGAAGLSAEGLGFQNKEEEKVND